MRTTTLGQACNLKAGKFVSANDIADEYADGLYPCFGGNGVRGYVKEFSHEGTFPLIGRQGALCGNVNLASGKFRATEHAVVVQPNVEMNIRWLYYQLLAMDLGQYATGAAQPGLAVATLEKLLLTIPPMDAQEKIVVALDKVSDLIALRKQQLTKLDELVKARFVEMFGDPVRNDKGWQLASLASLAEIKIGPFGSLLHKEDYVRGGHALVNPSHIIDGQIVTDDNLTVSETKYAEMEAYHLRKGDIVLGRRGEMGRCAVVYDDGLLCGTGSLIIRPATEMLPYFLQKIISHPTFKESIEDMAVGVTMMNLNVPIVSNFMIPVLPLEKQSAYLRFVGQTEKSKSQIQTALTKLETLKKALMQQYFG